MKLLMISGDRALASGKRGAFYATLEELSKYFDRIDVLCPRSKVSGEQVFFGHVHVHPSPRGLWYQPLWIFLKGGYLFAQHHHAVATVHEYPPFYNGIGAFFLHIRTRIPYVLEIHHVVGYPVASDWREWCGRNMYALYFRTIGRKAAALRVVNAGTRALLVSWGVSQERIHIVSSFYLDHGFLQPDSSIKKTRDIVFCGRLVANKGVENLLSVAEKAHGSRQLTTNNPPLRVLIIGDGSLRSSLEARSSQLAAHVTFTGWLPALQDVYRAIQSAKIFVMCSKSEGGPRTALEAMALGLPVIVTRVGVMPEVIQNGVNGLFTTGEPDDLAEKIRLLLSDEPLRIRIGNEARKILERFERNSLVARYADFLKSFV